MATIQTSISVQDGLSDAFARMTKSIESTNKEYSKIQQLISGGLNSTPINNANNAQQRLNETANESNSIFGKLRGTIIGVGLALGSALSASKVLEVSDSLSQLNGRLSLVDDGLLSLEETQRRIFASAQQTGTAYAEVANSVASLRQRAGSVFQTNESAIEFANLLNKSFNIAGASQQEVASATLQLTQALGSGALRGEELNAVLEAAPNIVQRIADELNVPFSQIKDLASEGVITADIIRNSLINAADDINAEFQALPFTSGQLWTKVKNDAIFAFEGVLTGINATLNGERFSSFIQSVSTSLYFIGGIATQVFNTLAALGAFIYDNWAYIGPIFIGVGTALGLMAARWALVTSATTIATAAQWAYNAALSANPIGLIILSIAALIGILVLVVNVINEVTGSSVSAVGVILGTLTAALAIIGNIFVALFTIVIDVFKNIYNVAAGVAEFFANVFRNPLTAAARLFVDFANGVIGIVNSIARAIDKVFGSNLASGLDSLSNRLSSFVDENFGENSIQIKRFAEDDFDLKRFEVGKAYDLGYNFGQGIGNKLSNIDLTAYTNPQTAALNNMAGDISAIKDSTGKTAENTAVTKEDLKYLRDATNAEALNRFAGISISVEMNNANTINSALDLDGIVDSLAERLEESLYTTAEGL